MTLRVQLLGRSGEMLAAPPGRLLLAHGDHSLAEVSEAIDVAFGRWDLSPTHEFSIGDRRLVSGDAARLDTDEDSDDVTVGELGLTLGSRFTYLFDPGEGWRHDCRVDATDVDPVEEYGETPAVPVPLYGWGSIPDQYGALSEDDADPPDDDTAGDGAPRTTAWPEPEASSWEVVASALAAVKRPRHDGALAAAVARLRDLEDNDDWPYDVLWAAGGLDDGELPEDDETLWLALAAGVVRPQGALPLDGEREEAWAALDPADFAGAVIELARGGVGQPADALAIIQLIARCPEVEGEPLTTADEQVLLAGLETVVALWKALGALDAADTLTPLGFWGLPESLRVAWEGPGRGDRD